MVLIFLSSFTCLSLCEYRVLRDDFHLSALAALAACPGISLLLLQRFDIPCDLFGGEVHFLATNIY